MVVRRKNFLVSSGRRRRIFFRWLFSGLAAIATASVLVLLLRLEAMQIKALEISAGATVEASEIEEAVKEELSKKTLGLLPRSSILFYPGEKIREKLTANFPAIESVSLERDFPSTLKISVSERKPSFLYCQSAVEIVEAGEAEGLAAPLCFLADKAGFIFAVASSIPKDLTVFESRVGEDSNPLNQPIVEQGLFEKILTVIETLKRSGVAAARVALDGEDSPRLETSSGWTLYLNPQESTTTIARNLTAVLSSPNLREKTEEEFRGLEYIDLRYGNKVFIKFKDR